MTGKRATWWLMALTLTLAACGRGVPLVPFV